MSDDIDYFYEKYRSENEARFHSGHFDSDEIARNCFRAGVGYAIQVVKNMQSCYDAEHKNHEIARAILDYVLRDLGCADEVTT